MGRGGVRGRRGQIRRMSRDSVSAGNGGKGGGLRGHRPCAPSLGRGFAAVGVSRRRLFLLLLPFGLGLAFFFGYQLDQTLASPTCDVSWKAAANGNWSDGANWSTGAAPTSSQNACITLDGTYIITLHGSASVASLQLGGSTGTQTIAIEGTPAAGPSAVPAVLTIGSGGASIGVPGVVALQDVGSGSGGATLNTSAGTLTNAGTLHSINGNSAPAGDPWA